MSTPTWHELTTMDEAELARRFDDAAPRAEGGIAFWGDVLIYRSAARTADELHTLNRRVYYLTGVATLAAVASVLAQLLNA